MNTAAASAVFGLASALIWGAADFCGGLGARRASVLSVLLVAEFSGLGLLILFAFLFGETVPAWEVILWGTIAGLSGTVGLGALYRGLTIGRASIVAPVSAVVGSSLPALYSAFTIGLPDDPLKRIGFGLALAAIVLASQASQEGAAGKGALLYAAAAGLGFGAFFIFIDRAGSQGSTFVPLAIARGFSIPVILIVMLLRRAPLPTGNMLPIIVLSGALDAGGNVFFLLSSTLGRLDVATILSSLYPASTVILSRIILHEKTTRLQQAGVLLALAAIVFIAL